MGMRYLSCRADSAILTCDSHIQTAIANHTTSRNDKKNKKKNNKNRALEEETNILRIQHFNYSDLEAPTDGFSLEKLLGRGSHGCFYKGVLHGGRLVAVKKPSCPCRGGRGGGSNPHTSSIGSNNGSTNEQ